MDWILADVRQALRMMLKNPGFTTVAVAALALGIGANTAIFSVVDKVLLEPLPYPESDRLVRLTRKFPDGAGKDAVSIPKYMTWRQNNVFSAMALYDQTSPGFNLSTGDAPEPIRGVHVSVDYFKVFGINPEMGRGFTSSEDSPNGPKAAVIAYGLWKSHFGGDPQILGKVIVLDGDSYPVVGLMPRKFVADPPADIWIPLQADPNSTNQGHYLSAAARLRPGASIEEARAEMKMAGERVRRLNPKWMNKGESVAVTSMRDSMVRDVRTALLVLVGAVAFVLLIACANVANLLLARGASRQKELAIRAAMGASRWRVVRQLLTESIFLSGLGGILGFILGAWGVRSLVLLVPVNIPRLTNPDHVQSLLTLMDWRIAAFTVGVSFLTGIVFGLFPALQISNPDLAGVLKESSGRSGTGRKQNRVRKTLVGAEMALALVLLASAALLIRTFVGLSTADPGIDPHHVLTVRTSLGGGHYFNTAKVENLIVQVVRSLELAPGIQAAAVTVVLPTTAGIDMPFNIAGRALKSGEMYNGDEQWRFISPHYFAVFRIPLLRGRVLNERDVSNSTRVLVINQAMAKKYWPNEDPLGQVMTIGKGFGPQFEEPSREIVGVVGNVRETGLGEADVPVMYVPHAQVSEALNHLANSVIPLSWCIRSSMDPISLRSTVHKQFAAIDPLLPLSELKMMPQILAEGTARENFNMLLLSIFAAVALVLAAIGIYGLMSYSVEQQAQEFGIRMALGANRPQLLKLVIRQGMLPVLIGIAVGVALAFGATRTLASLLYGVKPADPLSFCSVALTLLAVALLATYVPARRATNVDPMTALRQE
jgi:putative ABC transport system permease protein